MERPRNFWSLAGSAAVIYPRSHLLAAAVRTSGEPYPRHYKGLKTLSVAETIFLAASMNPLMHDKASTNGHSAVVLKGRVRRLRPPRDRRPFVLSF